MTKSTQTETTEINNLLAQKLGLIILDKNSSTLTNVALSVSIDLNESEIEDLDEIVEFIKSRKYLSATSLDNTKTFKLPLNLAVTSKDEFGNTKFYAHRAIVNVLQEGVNHELLERTLNAYYVFDQINYETDENQNSESTSKFTRANELLNQIARDEKHPLHQFILSLPLSPTFEFKALESSLYPNNSSQNNSDLRLFIGWLLVSYGLGNVFSRLEGMENDKSSSILTKANPFRDSALKTSGLSNNWKLGKIANETLSKLSNIELGLAFEEYRQVEESLQKKERLDSAKFPSLQRIFGSIDHAASIALAGLLPFPLSITAMSEKTSGAKVVSNKSKKEGKNFRKDQVFTSFLTDILLGNIPALEKALKEAEKSGQIESLLTSFYQEGKIEVTPLIFAINNAKSEAIEVMLKSASKLDQITFEKFLMQKNQDQYSAFSLVAISEEKNWNMAIMIVKSAQKHPNILKSILNDIDPKSQTPILDSILRRKHFALLFETLEIVKQNSPKILGDLLTQTPNNQNKGNILFVADSLGHHSQTTKMLQLIDKNPNLINKILTAKAPLPSVLNMITISGNFEALKVVFNNNPTIELKNLKVEEIFWLGRITTSALTIQLLHQIDPLFSLHTREKGKLEEIDIKQYDFTSNKPILIKSQDQAENKVFGGTMSIITNGEVKDRQLKFKEGGKTIKELTLFANKEKADLIVVNTILSVSVDGNHELTLGFHRKNKDQWHVKIYDSNEITSSEFIKTINEVLKKSGIKIFNKVSQEPVIVPNIATEYKNEGSCDLASSFNAAYLLKGQEFVKSLRQKCKEIDDDCVINLVEESLGSINTWQQEKFKLAKERFIKEGHNQPKEDKSPSSKVEKPHIKTKDKSKGREEL